MWVGLTNSDDVGLYFDLLAQVFVDGVLVGSGELDKVWGGSSGFNNAVMSTIPLNFVAPFPPVNLPPGSELSIRVSVRQACTAPRERFCIHTNECKARLWYNDKQAASRFDATIENGDPDFFLVKGFLLSETPGVGPKLTADRDAGSRCSPFKAFGEWKITTDP